MVSGAQADLVAVGNRGQVVRVDAGKREGDDARAAGRRRTVDGQAVHLAHRLVRVLGDLELVRPHRIHAQPVQVVDRRAQADDFRNRLRAGLELPGQVVVGRALDPHRADHVAACHERVHRLEQLAASVENSGAGRSEHLVAAERIEVAAQRAHVDRLVRSALRAVDEHGGARLLGRGHHLARGVDGSHRVADQVERDQLRAAPQQVRELVLPQLALLVDVDVFDVGAFFGGEDLPGHDVRVVVEDRQHDQVA